MTSPRPVRSGRLVRVVDGDSIVVEIAGKKHDVRLHGIDAPEYAQPLGPEAAKQLQTLVHQADTELYYMQTINDSDRYHRMVAAIRPSTQRETLNYSMVRSGYAYAYPDHGGLHPTILDAEQNARYQQLGVWSYGPQGLERPWNYRKRQQGFQINPKWLIAAAFATIVMVAFYYASAY